MHITIFLPDNDEAAVREALTRAIPNTRVLDPGTGTEAREYHEALAEALAAPEKSDLLFLNPPAGEGDLDKIDAAFRERFGRKGLVRAVFFSPFTSGKDDALKAYRDRVRPAFRHFRKDGRTTEFAKLLPKKAVKAVKLARKSASSIRWGALGPVLVLFVVIVAGAFLLRDVFAKKAILGAMESAFLARANASGLATTLTPSIRIENFSVADRKDPMKNLFEFETFNGDVDLMALTSGRFHVNDATLEGLRFQTERESSGALPEAGEVGEDGKAPAPPAEEPPAPKPDFRETLEGALDTLVEMFDPPKLEELETVKEARRIKKECRERLARLEEGVKKLDVQARYEKARASLEALAKRPPPEAVKKVQARYEEFKNMDAGGEQVRAVQGALENATKLAFAEEKQALDKAKRDLLAVKQTVDKTRSLVKRAKAVKKVSLLQVPEIKSLLDDLDEVSRGLTRAQSRLSSAANGIEKARSGLEEKKARFEKMMASGDSGLEEARAALEENAPQVTEAYEELQKDLGGAKAEFEKERADVLGTLGAIEKDLATLVDQALALEKQLEEDVKFLLAQRGVLEEALETDRRNLEARYGLESFDAESLMKPLVGESIAGWLMTGLRTYERLKPYLASDEKEEKPVTRRPASGGGTVFEFPTPSGAPPEEPAVWIKKLRFSGVFPFRGREFSLEGTATNLASDLGFTKQPVTVNFVAEKDGQVLKAGMELLPEGRFSIHFEASGFPVSGLRFKGRYVPREIKAESLTLVLDAVFEGKTATCKASLELKGLAFTTDFEGADRRIASVLEDVFGGIRDVSAEIEMVFVGPVLRSFRTKTDLAETVAEAFEKALSAQIDQVKQEALRTLDEKTRVPMQKALASVEAFSSGGKAKLGPAVQESSSAKDRALSDKGKVTGRFEALGKILEIGGDPAEAISLRRKELDDLDRKLVERAEAFANDREAQEALLEEAVKLLNAQKRDKDGANKDLDSEIKRLKELIKKAVPW